MPEQPRGPRLYVNRDRTRVVPAGSPEAAVMMHEKDIRALGIKFTKADTEPKPEEPEAEEEKAQEPAANKARSRGEDK